MPALSLLSDIKVADMTTALSDLIARKLLQVCGRMSSKWNPYRVTGEKVTALIYD